MIEWDSAMPIAMQAELLGSNRTSLYCQPVAVSAEELAIKHRRRVAVTYPWGVV
jgi:hypothetical protein